MKGVDLEMMHEQRNIQFQSFCQMAKYLESTSLKSWMKTIHDLQINVNSSKNGKLPRGNSYSQQANC